MRMLGALLTTLVLAGTAAAQGYTSAVPAMPPGATQIVRDRTTSSGTLYTVSANKVFHLVSAWGNAIQQATPAANCDVTISSLFVRSDDGATARKVLQVSTGQLANATQANSVGPMDLVLQGHCSTTVSKSCFTDAQCGGVQTCVAATVSVTLSGAGCNMASGIVGWEAGP